MSHFMLRLHSFLSVLAPSLSKCIVAPEGVRKSLLCFICIRETGKLSQKANLDSSCMDSFVLALGETYRKSGREKKKRQMVRQFFFCFTVTLTDSLVRSWQRKASISAKSVMPRSLAAGFFFCSSNVSAVFL